MARLGGMMYDEPTHFNNEIPNLFFKGLRAAYHFTHIYCPSYNGEMECIGKVLLRVECAFFSDLQIRHDDWPQLLPLF